MVVLCHPILIFYSLTFSQNQIKFVWLFLKVAGSAFWLTNEPHTKPCSCQGPFEVSIVTFKQHKIHPMTRSPSCVLYFEISYVIGHLYMLFLRLFIHSPLHVVLFAMATGVMGVSVLTSQVNGLTATLG